MERPPPFVCTFLRYRLPHLGRFGEGIINGPAKRYRIRSRGVLVRPVTSFRRLHWKSGYNPPRYNSFAYHHHRIRLSMVLEVTLSSMRGKPRVSHYLTSYHSGPARMQLDADITKAKTGMRKIGGSANNSDAKIISSRSVSGKKRTRKSERCVFALPPLLLLY